MEQKNQTQQLAKLETQLMRQRANSLTKYVKTREEGDIVNAIADVRIKDIGKEDADRLIEVVGKWGFYMGSSARLSSDDILMLCKFLRENYNFLTINELSLAINLNLKGTLGEIDYYGNLSPLFMSQVLNAYLDHKRDYLKSVFDRKERDEIKPTPKLTREEELKMIRDAFKLEYSKFKKGEVVDDLFSIIYEFIDKNKRYTPSEDAKKGAFEFAQKMIVKENYKKANNIGDLIRNAVNKDDTLAFEKYFQNYLVMDLFSTIDNIDDYINNIRLEEML